MSDFMKKQITSAHTHWLKVETNCGTTFVRLLDTEFSIPLENGNAKDEAERAETIQQYCEGKVESWETIVGFGARLSAPGYLDCTEWSVFDTEEEARQYLVEMYDADNEEDGEDEIERARR